MLLFSFSVYYYMRYGRLPIREIRLLFLASFKTVVLLLPLMLLNSFASAGGKWALKKDSEGIKIFTSEVANSDVKARRAELTTAGTPAQLAAILMDINKQKDWVYSTESSNVVKKISSTELIYYSEKDMPWLVTNRDAVMRLKIEQNSSTGVMTVTANTVDKLVAAKKDVIRVPSSTVSWVVTPTGSNSMKIVYEAELDPGGSVPAWIVNMFTTKGPLETFKKLKGMLAG
jgi:hypothetical protein